MTDPSPPEATHAPTDPSAPEATRAPTRWQRDGAAMAAITLGGCLATVWLGERIGVNDGQGWDGMAYAQWAGDFWNKVIVAGLTRYHSQRILPSAIVHYALRLVGAKPDLPHIIAGFQILDTVILIGASVLWAHLGHAMRWSRAAVWVGFVALLFGYANARHALYYPTLTDPTAFGLGMLLVWSYVTDRGWLLWATGVLGIFVWPALPPLAMAMLVAPRAASRASAPATRLQRAVAVALAAGAAAIFAFVALHYLAHPVPGVGDEKFAQWVRRDVLWLTLGALAAMLVAGWYFLLRQPALWDVRAYLRQLRLRRTLWALAGVALAIAIKTLWLRRVGVRGEGPTGAQFLCEHSLAAIRGPLWGLVHQVVYFGPIVLVALLSWRRICALCAGWGPSAALALAMIVAFAAGSNSRQWNHLLPFLVVVTIAATHERWNRRTAIVFIVAALAWSKIWWKQGYDVHDNWRRFPNQAYFMNHGPYANDQMYLVHLAAALVTLFALYLAFRAKPAPA